MSIVIVSLTLLKLLKADPEVGFRIFSGVLCVAVSFGSRATALAEFKAMP